jgi:hypothetical protein
MSRPTVRVFVAVVIAYLLGWIAGRLPSPHDPAVFWISNVGGPYLVVGFVAGAWATRRAVSATVVGSVCAAAAVCGLYDFLTIGSNARGHQGLPPGTPWFTAAAQAYRRWFALLLWGGVPWLTIAIVIGLAAGYLGHRWAASRSRLGIIAVGAALILEPILYISGLNAHLRLGATYARSAHNIAMWGIEELLGLSIVVVAWRLTPRPVRHRAFACRLRSAARPIRHETPGVPSAALWPSMTTAAHSAVDTTARSTRSPRGR